MRVILKRMSSNGSGQQVMSLIDLMNCEEKYLFSVYNLVTLLPVHHRGISMIMVKVRVTP